jgi:hypothetical protein
LAEGLTIHILYEGQRSVGFIEYLPGEHAWRAVNAEGYLLIHCLWVVGKAKRKGYGSRLLNRCLDDARQRDARGVAVVTSERPWLTKRKLFQVHGFEQADSAPPVFELWVRRFHEAPLPRFPSDWEKRISRSGTGLTVYHSAQCPYLERATASVLRSTEELGIEARAIEFQSSGELRRHSPSAHGVFGVVYDGELLTVRYPDDTFRQKLRERVEAKQSKS